MVKFFWALEKKASKNQNHLKKIDLLQYAKEARKYRRKSFKIAEFLTQLADQVEGRNDE